MAYIFNLLSKDLFLNSCSFLSLLGVLFPLTLRLNDIFFFLEVAFKLIFLDWISWSFKARGWLLSDRYSYWEWGILYSHKLNKKALQLGELVSFCLGFYVLMSEGYTMKEALAIYGDLDIWLLRVMFIRTRSVSYTHLTLPTIYSV